LRFVLHETDAASYAPQRGTYRTYRACMSHDQRPNCRTSRGCPQI
jgi:hypothetical protein